MIRQGGTITSEVYICHRCNLTLKIECNESCEYIREKFECPDLKVCGLCKRKDALELVDAVRWQEEDDH